MAKQIVTCEICAMCKSRLYDPVNLGDLYEYEDLKLHYYCVLLSYSLEQKGEDDEGLFGFLYKDIKNELNKHRTKICCFCKKKGAVMKCAECAKRWHLPCGILKNCLSIFTGPFPSFCRLHRPIQEIPPEIKSLLSEINPEDILCPVCFEVVDIKDKYDSLWARCCTKTFYHRQCVVRLGLAEGSLFNCAFCANKEIFKEDMIKLGIYVPERDAIWEEPGAYADLEYQYSKCNAPNCICPDGRECDNSGSRWEILVCEICGSRGTHVTCGGLKFYTTNWRCQECFEILNKKEDKFQEDEEKFGLLETCEENIQLSKNWGEEKEVEEELIDVEEEQSPPNSCIVLLDEKQGSELDESSNGLKRTIDYLCLIAEKNSSMVNGTNSRQAIEDFIELLYKIFPNKVVQLANETDELTIVQQLNALAEELSLEKKHLFGDEDKQIIALSKADSSEKSEELIVVDDEIDEILVEKIVYTRKKEKTNIVHLEDEPPAKREKCDSKKNLAEKLISISKRLAEENANHKTIAKELLHLAEKIENKEQEIVTVD